MRATAPVDRILPGVALTVAAPRAKEVGRPIELGFVAVSVHKFRCEEKQG